MESIWIGEKLRKYLKKKEKKLVKVLGQAKNYLEKQKAWKVFGVTKKLGNSLDSQTTTTKVFGQAKRIFGLISAVTIIISIVYHHQRIKKGGSPS